MKINNIQNRYTSTKAKTEKPKSPAFSAVPVYKVKLRQLMEDGTVRYRPALISKLDYFDEADKSLMSKIKKAWNGKAKYLHQITNAFDYQDPSLTIFKLERLDIWDQVERVQSLMAVDNPDKPLYPLRMVVRFLQAAPQILEDRLNSTVRGSGELMLYAGAKLAREKKLYKGLGIIADQHTFYEHLGLQRDRPPYEEYMYTVLDSKLDAFMSRIEQKYCFQNQTPEINEITYNITNRHQSYEQESKSFAASV